MSSNSYTALTGTMCKLMLINTRINNFFAILRRFIKLYMYKVFLSFIFLQKTDLLPYPLVYTCFDMVGEFVLDKSNPGFAD